MNRPIQNSQAQPERGHENPTEGPRTREEMAKMRTALLREDLTARAVVAKPGSAAAVVAPTPGTSEGNWENEGGPLRSKSASGPTGGQRVA
jgi:hypothetical protein